MALKVSYVDVLIRGLLLYIILHPRKLNGNENQHSWTQGRCRLQKATGLVSAVRGTDKHQTIVLWGGYFPVWMCLVIEFECVISVCEVLLRLFLYSPFVPGSRSVRTIEKVSGWQAGSAASGILEWKGEVAPSFSTRPRLSPARIFNRPHRQRDWNRLVATVRHINPDLIKEAFESDS